MLQSTITLLFLCLYCVVVLKVDKSYFGTYWTPTPLLLVPFTCVVLVHFLFGDLLGFAPLASEVTTVWIVGSFVFWITGHGLRQVWTGRVLAKIPAGTSSEGPTTNRVALWSIFGALVSVVLLVHASAVLQQMGGISALASQNFQNQWGIGWPAHIRMVLEVIIIMVLGSARRWSLSVVVSLALMLLVILLQIGIMT